MGVAVSGGIDSVALLRLLVELRGELGIVLAVVHFNHKLRGVESDADESFVAELATEHKLEFYGECADVAAWAAEEHMGVEAASRDLRYEFFGRLMRPAEDSRAQVPHPKSRAESNGTAEAVPFPNPPLDKIATGHTLDDQAETVLMRVIRGTGMRGLAGIYPRVVVEEEDSGESGHSGGEIIRPLLGIQRRELEQYLTELKQPWREDSSNADARFTRNRVRQLVLPLLEREFNPAIADNLSEMADIARGEEDYWENEISGWLGTVVQWSQPKWARELERAQSLVQIEAPGTHSHAKPGEAAKQVPEEWLDAVDASISRAWLLTEPLAVQRRVIKAIGEHARIPLEFQNVEEILRFAGEDGPSGKEMSLPRGWKAIREHEAVHFSSPDPRQQEKTARDYEYRLLIPGRVVVPETGSVFEALRLPPKSQGAEYNPQQLLNASLLPAELTLRNWRPGDRFWPAHTKAPRKIKELFQDRHVPQAERALWPVAVSGDEIVWMRGFPVPARLGAQPQDEAVLVREKSLGEDEG